MSDDPILPAELPEDASIDIGLAAESSGDGGTRRATRFIARRTRGPLLSADEFARYVQAHKPSGNKLLQMAESSLAAADRRADVRQGLEFRALERAMRYVFVLVLAVVALLGVLALVLILRGEIVIGTLIGAGEGVLVSLIGLVTVWARRRGQRPRQPAEPEVETAGSLPVGEPPVA